MVTTCFLYEVSNIIWHQFGKDMTFEYLLIVKLDKYSTLSTYLLFYKKNYSIIVDKIRINHDVYNIR